MVLMIVVLSRELHEIKLSMCIRENNRTEQINYNE